MKALTVRPPWAWLIVKRHKPIENRDWAPTPLELGIGEPFIVHQGKTWAPDGFELARQLGILVPTKKEMEAAGLLGAVLGVATYGGVLPSLDDLFPDLAAMRWGQEGKLVWLLPAVEEIAPIPARGFEKLWNASAALVERVEEGLRVARAKK